MIGFLFRRFRWMAMGYVARIGVKALGRRQVETATSDLRDRLPNRAVKVADALPGDVLRAGGSAVVAGQTAMRTAKGAKKIATTKERAREKLQTAKAELDDQVQADERSFRSDLIRHTRGDDEATDALLDVRGALEHNSLPKVGPPASQRRWRRSARTVPLVERVQRRYQRPQKAWE